MKIIFLSLILLSGCTIYPGGHVAGAFDQSAINNELNRTNKEMERLEREAP